MTQMTKVYAPCSRCGGRCFPDTDGDVRCLMCGRASRLGTEREADTGLSTTLHIQYGWFNSTRHTVPRGFSS